MNSQENDTIAAISTPPGRGGLGVVRLSGPQALELASGLLRLAAPLEHARARVTAVLDPDGPGSPDADVLDEAVVTFFQAPRSYTGEDLVEITAHGSPVVLDALLRAAVRAGARLAAPGEFTQRAFLSGRMDLTQAEAVHDLIAAHTLEQVRMAAQQLGGALARRVAPVKERLVHLIALLEAGMDFAPGELDDVSTVPPAEIALALSQVREPLDALACSFRHGQLLRSGASIALVGPPNAGKSSVFNSLLQRGRAIVTPLPGTTRDTIEESFALEGIPIRLVDTAGLREPETIHALDEAETQGIARSHEALADADVVLLVHDATQPLSAAERALAASLEDRPHLTLYNKVDLLTRRPEPRDSSSPQDSEPILTSAITGEGLSAVRSALLQQLRGGAEISTGAALNNQRQRQAVDDALTALHAAGEANLQHLPHEIVLVDLHNALRALDSLTGQTTTEDILGRIFSTFCIGK